MGFRLEPRLEVPRWVNLAVPAGALVLALIAGGVLFALLGVNPLQAYGEMFKGALGSAYGASEVVVKAIPLTLTGLAGALCYRMLLWNIGMEGQLHLGALAGFLKARFHVNEIITTLMLNYIGILLVDYFIYGAWKDPTSLGFPMTAAFPDAARLFHLGDTRIHLGLLLALGVAAVFRVVLRWTRWGYEIRVIGENPKAAAYGGIPLLRNVVLVMFVSGAVAGLAGMGEVAGLQGRLARGFSTGYGYTGIIVAWLARLNPLAVPLVAFFLGILLVGGDTLQIVMGLPLASTQVLQGLILFFLLAGETFCRYRVRPVRRRGEE